MGCGADEGNGTAPGATPTATPDGTASPTDPRRVDLENTTRTLPEWPDPATRVRCPAGTYSFRDGVAETASSWEYHMTFLGEPTYADVDRRGGEEILTTVGCGPPRSEAVVSMLAVRVEGPAPVLGALGYVQERAAQFQSVVRARVEGDTVILTTREGIGPGSPEQVRAFRWQGEAFTPVSTPSPTP